MTKKLSKKEIDLTVQYFLSLKGKGELRIEVELKKNDEEKFRQKYYRLTKQEVPTDSKAYTLLMYDADKWGIELRIYYVSDGKEPDIVKDIRTKPRKDRNDMYTHRLNNNDVIWKLLESGLLLGDN